MLGLVVGRGQSVDYKVIGGLFFNFYIFFEYMILVIIIVNCIVLVLE